MERLYRDMYEVLYCFLFFVVYATDFLLYS
jgi:hypothetical protein